MTTGSKNSLRGLLAGLFLLCGLGMVQADEEAVAQVFAALAVVPEREVAFVEERIDQMLGVPLQSRGVLRYRAPDYLAREIRQGGQGSYVIEGEMLRVEYAGQQRELPLDSHPALAGLAGLLRAVLAGDRDSLQAHYRLDWRFDADHWQLTLRPREAALSRWLAEARISGQGGNIHLLVIDEAGGDQIRTRLLPHADD